MFDRIPCVEVRIRATEHFLALIIKFKHLIRASVWSKNKGVGRVPRVSPLDPPLRLYSVIQGIIRDLFHFSSDALFCLISQLQAQYRLKTNAFSGTIISVPFTR